MRHEDKLQLIGLSTVEERSEGGNLIILYNNVTKTVKFNEGEFII